MVPAPARRPGIGGQRAYRDPPAVLEACRRPDCLLIDDDNHVPYATAGIDDAGLMPADLAVAAHANFPDVTRSLVPFRRFGFDAETVTAATHAELTRLQAGGATRVIDIAAEVRSTAQ